MFRRITNKTSLEDQLGSVSQELVRKKAALGQAVLAGQDTAGMIDQVSQLEGKITSLQAALEVQGQQRQQAVKDQGQDARRKTEQAALKKKTQGQYLKTVKALTVLEEELQALSDCHKALARSGAGQSPSIDLPYHLTSEVTLVINYLKFTDPVSLGLPPLPTKEQVKQREQRHQKARIAKRLAELKSMDQRGDTGSDIKRMIKDLEALQ